MAANERFEYEMQIKQLKEQIMNMKKETSMQRVNLNNSGSTQRSGNVLVGSPQQSDKKAKVPRLNNLATVTEEGDKDILSKSSNQPIV